jgi:hypothetical protein
VALSAYLDSGGHCGDGDLTLWCIVCLRMVAPLLLPGIFRGPAISD